ncbi:alcohol dehydrogenase [Cladophialophora psammophila CBS 110553]|uniref:Alcohol dehydrogenase n=1 Tax=Cladophialophora psammophila CBS 110553 TaxID=1182543 RepID=W9X8I6_9EURO|nr:alcohol dehydrogenase [Cladophialophora psammophila CBS 110553]EXJ76533.1 alcohol dehydrogenase [Cladophialophora psammophila CBS 110553]
MTTPSAPLPRSVLGRHRLLAPSASVHVSPLCLGGMNFGDAWSNVMGECTKETAFEILDHFYEMGGNFIDTANNYQAEQSETWIGEWLALHGPYRRDEMVLATKYSSGYKVFSEPQLQQSNFGANSTKSLALSVEASLKKLQTTYIDLLYVHYWDFTTGVEEMMQSLNHLVQQGKVLYLGISDTPAWVVAKANAYARHHGLRPFSVYQGRWSAAERDFERDIIPMCRDEGMGLAPWGALGGGYFKPSRPTEEQQQGGGRNMASVRTGKEAQVSVVLEKVANARNPPVPLTSIALAYVMHKTPYVTPIVGGRKLSHLRQNIEALTIRLTAAEIDEIESAYPFDVGFPMNFIAGNNPKGPRGPEDISLTKRMGHFDFVKGLEPILPPAGVEKLSEAERAKVLGYRLS